MFNFKKSKNSLSLIVNEQYLQKLIFIHVLLTCNQCNDFALIEKNSFFLMQSRTLAFVGLPAKLYIS